MSLHTFILRYDCQACGAIKHEEFRPHAAEDRLLTAEELVEQSAERGLFFRPCHCHCRGNVSYSKIHGSRPPAILPVCGMALLTSVTNVHREEIVESLVNKVCEMGRKPEEE